jgi:hypothetical protein
MLASKFSAPVRSTDCRIEKIENSLILRRVDLGQNPLAAASCCGSYRAPTALISHELNQNTTKQKH